MQSFCTITYNRRLSSCDNQKTLEWEDDFILILSVYDVITKKIVDLIYCFAAHPAVSSSVQSFLELVLS